MNAFDAWHTLTNRKIKFHSFDVSRHYHRLLSLIEDWKPDAIVHFAEQRAAPYSMKSSWHKRYTVNNNLNAKNNLLAAIVDSGRDVHVVHLGTMGVYGYGVSGIKIPGRILESESRWRKWRRDKSGDIVSGQPGQHLSYDKNSRSADIWFLQQKMMASESPIFIKALYGALRPKKREWTNG